jgi:hypothetical protein
MPRQLDRLPCPQDAQGWIIHALSRLLMEE